MNKAADILDTLKSRVSDAGNGLGTWYATLDPTLKSTVIRGLAGAAVGGGLAGGAAALVPKDDGHKRNIMGPAMLGALMGGGAAATVPLGLKMMGSGMSFSSESKKSPLEGGLDYLLTGGLKHPVTSVATGAALLNPGTRTAWGQFLDLWRQRTQETGGKASVTDVLREMSEKAKLSDKLTHMAPSVADAAKAGPEAGQAAAKARKIVDEALSKGVSGAGHMHPRRLATIPAALGLGLLADRYIRGDY